MSGAETSERIIGEDLEPEVRERLPNLVIAGFMKCGTSSLHRYLDLHPQISMSRQKEPDFFLTDRNWSRGVRWYAEMFDRSKPVRGEASVNYTNLPVSEGVAERMRDLLGAPKLIFMVRDPIERSLSHYLHARASGRTELSLEQALGDLGSRFVDRSRYARQLEPFLAAFDPETLLIRSQEELRDRRQAVMREVFEFLGVDRDFSSPRFEREWEVTAGKDRKFQLAYRLSRRLGDKTFWGRVPPRLRAVAERIVLAPTDRSGPPQVPEPIRRRLAAELGPEADRLREIAGRDFPGWSV